MQHCKKILRELGKQLSLDYCSAEQRALPISEVWCRDCLMPAFSKCWNFKYERLNGERTISDALKGIKCSSGTKEKLAILHYAKTDPAVAALMPKLFLDLEGKERTLLTPYWNWWVEEYKMKHQPNAAKVNALNELMHALETLKKEELDKRELDKIERKVKELRRGWK